MANVNSESYERLITALTAFNKSNLEIADYLMTCAEVAIQAMGNDDPSTAFHSKICTIVNKMGDVCAKADNIKVAMEDTLRIMQEIKQAGEDNT